MAERDNHSAAVSAALEADGRMRFRLGVTAATIGVLLLGIVVVCANWSSPPEPSRSVLIVHGPDYDKPASHPSASLLASGSAAKTGPKISLSPEQIRFTAVVESFIPKYYQAKGDFQATGEAYGQVEKGYLLGNIRRERKDALTQYFSAVEARRFQHWVGQVTSNFPSSNLDGTVSAVFAIKLQGTPVVLETATAPADLEAETLREAVARGVEYSPLPNTMISRNDPLYQSVMGLHEGDDVTVSGMFLSGGAIIYTRKV